MLSRTQLFISIDVADFILMQLGFAWTARVLGFINLGALSLCVAFMRPRLPPRKSGPLIDWSAFREPVWNVFIVGWWLVMWSNYYTFYYVSHSTHHTYLLDHFDRIT